MIGKGCQASYPVCRQYLYGPKYVFFSPPCFCYRVGVGGGVGGGGFSDFQFIAFDEEALLIWCLFQTEFASLTDFAPLQVERGEVPSRHDVKMTLN